jgi:serine/threonine protein kinase
MIKVYLKLKVGYLRITDFGVAKISQKENSNETSGTPGYMAPEVMCAQNHSYAVDYFAVGVIAYEFMLGVRPYLGKSRKEIKEMILAKQVQVKHSEIPPDWSVEAVTFINEVCLY